MNTRYVASFVAVGCLVAIGACSDTTEPNTMNTTAGSGGSPAGVAGTAGMAGSSAGMAGTPAGGGMAGSAAGSAGAPSGGGGADSGGSGGSGGGADCDTKLGKAMKFVEGKKDMVAGDMAADAIMPDGARTVELWAKFSGPTSWKAEQSILELGKPSQPDNGNNVFGIDMSGRSNDGTKGVFGPYTHGVSDNNGNGAMPQFTAAEDVGWLHLAWAYDPTKAANMRLQFTVNGDVLPTEFNQSKWDATGGKLVLNTGYVLLGASQNFGNGGWDGIMDEMKIWNVFKPAADIKANMRVIPKRDAAGLVAYYKFDEGSGTDVLDSSAKNHKLSFCAAGGGACPSANDQAPTWVDSDIPAPAFTCAP